MTCGRGDMIIVYQFASEKSAGVTVDSTNLLFGPAAIAFSGLGVKSFAISQMGDLQTDPTWGWSDQAGWRQKLLNRRGYAFPKLVDKAFIISWEDLTEEFCRGKAIGDRAVRRSEIAALMKAKWGVSEQQVRDWWERIVGNGHQWKTGDCTDAVFRALQASLINRHWQGPFTRSVLYPLYTPGAAVDYARRLNKALMDAAGLTPNEYQTVVAQDTMWREANAAV